MLFIWIILYGLSYVLADRLSRQFGSGYDVTAAVMLLFVCAFVFWLHRTGRARRIGLQPMQRLAPLEYLSFLPLLALPLFNLLTGDRSTASLSYVLLMLGVSAAEEIFFRGYAFLYFSRRSQAVGILMSSAVFALFHTVNIFAHGNAMYTLVQMICAFSAGVCYSAAAIRYRSLYPCILAHFLTNLTAGISSAPVLQNGEIAALLLCSIIYLAHGWYLCRKA